jgi:hypothetical protein
MNSEYGKGPIFVHASPRGGSTYFFAVLRRIERLMCFNEAIIDIFGDFGKEGTANYTGSQSWNVNHKFFAGRGDFDEFVEAWDEVMHLYPMFPSFQDYLPANGILPKPLRDYLGALIGYAERKGKRAALCEVHSRGRAGALRHAFGGFHIAQYRDPLSQFGSFFRPLPEGGQWNFLSFPLFELGIAGNHPLYQIVPPQWRVPVLPWPVENRAQRWASATAYVAMVARPDAVEQVFRWHLFAWFLSNLAAISYSDMTLDLDKATDDPAYRQAIVAALGAAIGEAPDFTDLTRFTRYYEFEALDMARVADEVTGTIKVSLQDGRLQSAIASLGQMPPTVATEDAAELLLDKVARSLATMQASADRTRVSAAEWSAVVEKNRSIWFNPTMRTIAQRLYPLGAPLARAARRAGALR